MLKERQWAEYQSHLLKHEPGIEPELLHALTIGLFMITDLDARARVSRLKNVVDTCLLGTEAVEFMLAQQMVRSVEEAIHAGDLLLSDHFLKSRSGSVRKFTNEPDLYEFGAVSKYGVKLGELRSQLTREQRFILQEMKDHLDIRDRPFGFMGLRTHTDCFTGQNVVHFLREELIAASDGEALRIANRLMQTGALKSVTNVDVFVKDKDLLYRFGDVALREREKAPSSPPSQSETGSRRTPVSASQSASQSETSPMTNSPVESVISEHGLNSFDEEASELLRERTQTSDAIAYFLEPPSPGSALNIMASSLYCVWKKTKIKIIVAV
jgi:hypothetical protein